MVGELLKAIDKAGQYQDPAMKNVWNIINQHRIAGVHAKDAIPIPSKNQALMVCFGVLDCVRRMLEIKKALYEATFRCSGLKLLKSPITVPSRQEIAAPVRLEKSRKTSSELVPGSPQA